MLIDFDKIQTTELKNFYGGDGSLLAKMYQDENNKILKGTLEPGSNIGLHTHETSSEIIFVLSGRGEVLYDGELIPLFAGDCHYCKRGSAHSLRNNAKEALVFYAVVPQH